MNSRTNFMVHSACAVTHQNPNFRLLYFISVIVWELEEVLRGTINTYNANGCIVVTYLFKDVVKEVDKKNIINVKYSSNVQM